MSNSNPVFPLRGVIGIVDASADQLQLAVDSQLRCVEIRADLLRTAGMSDTEILSLIAESKTKGLGCLFTLRHVDQGGTFNSTESERVSVCELALNAGADIIDLEHGTDASVQMLKKSAPMILSYHNFDAMLDETELASLTNAMQTLQPAAIKIIPTGQSIKDAAQMLSWVGNASKGIKRIGFAMGREGGVSRILTLTQGAPITYASFGEPVAPGQIDITHLLSRYNCNKMTPSTKIVAVIGDASATDEYIQTKSKALSHQPSDCVWVGFDACDLELVKQLGTAMKISELKVL